MSTIGLYTATENELGAVGRAAAEVDASEMDVDELAERATEELLICDVCGESNDGVEQIGRDTSGGVLTVATSFECSECGATNENTAVFGGSGDE